MIPAINLHLGKEIYDKLKKKKLLKDGETEIHRFSDLAQSYKATVVSWGSNPNLCHNNIYVSTVFPQLSAENRAYG